MHGYQAWSVNFVAIVHEELRNFALELLQTRTRTFEQTPLGWY